MGSFPPERLARCSIVQLSCISGGGGRGGGAVLGGLPWIFILTSHFLNSA